MTIQLVVANSAKQHVCIDSTGKTVQSRRWLIILRLTVAIWACLTATITGVVALSRMSTVPTVWEPPQDLLPGETKSLPSNAKCSWDYHDRWVCWFDQGSTSIHLIYDDQTIVHMTTSSPQRTIGDLIIAWGTPTSMRQIGYFITVSWGTRFALLYTCPLQPNSPVILVEHSLKPKPLDAWRGFTSSSANCLAQIYR